MNSLLLQELLSSFLHEFGHHLIEGPFKSGTGEVVEDRIEHAVEIGQANCDVEGHLKSLSAFIVRRLCVPHPDQDPCDVAGQKTNGEHHHDQSQTQHDPPDVPVHTPLTQMCICVSCTEGNDAQ